MNMEPFDAYKKYLALKQHFSKDKYDYFKYNGKVNAKSSSFETRKDKYMFYKLSKKKDVEGYLVANMIENDNAWIGDLLSSESEQIYNEWLKKQQSISYIFENDISKLKDDLNENIMTKHGEYPFMLKLFFKKEICIETIVISNDILNFFNHWKNKIEDPVIWPDLYKKCLKYRSFVQFDRQHCLNILKNKFI